ncbi:unnamed protein product [Chrysoparadoxa australica]
MRLAVRHLCQVQHVAEETLLTILPAKWVQLALMEDAAYALLPPPELHDYVAGYRVGVDEIGRFLPRSKFQGQLTKAANTPRLVRFREMLASLPVPEPPVPPARPTVNLADAHHRRIESRRQAQARHLSQCSKGAMTFLRAEPAGGAIIPGNLTSIALRHAVGYWNHYGQCPKCSGTASHKLIRITLSRVCRSQLTTPYVTHCVWR